MAIGEPGAWTLRWVDPAVDPDVREPETGTWREVREREHLVGIIGRTPVMLNPRMQIDLRLSEFFRRSRFASLAHGTQESYALDYRLLFAFLWLRGKTWDEATEDDFRDWHSWRRIDANNPRPIGGSKWNRELAAFTLLYGWAARKGYVLEPPVVLSDLKARDARPSNVKWLTPRAYTQWRNVGLRGYGLDGLRDRAFRGRQDDRNTAFADLLFGTGVRLREGGALLLIELPEHTASGQRYLPFKIPDATAKRSGRTAYLAAEALQSVLAYCDSTRVSAVALAQQRGRYEAISNRLTVSRVTRSGFVTWTNMQGHSTEAGLNTIDAETRRRLFVQTEFGLEPMALWLDEAGMPMDYRAWKKIFRRASGRCARQGLRLWCTPKMLRHSFALQMLVSLQYAFDRRLGLSPAERKYYQEVYGNVWTMVRDLLGHRSEDTTRNIYLEPVRGLQLDSILNESVEPEVDDLLRRIARETGLVLDLA